MLHLIIRMGKIFILKNKLCLSVNRTTTYSYEFIGLLCYGF